MKCFCRFSLPLTILLAFFVVSINGCGDNLPKRVPVSGHVYFDGKPLEMGAIGILTQGERSSYAKLGPGGKFTVSTFSENDGLMPGKHKFAVAAKEDLSPTSQKWFVPKKYSDPNTSGLEIDITGPTDDLKIELTSEPGQKYPWVEKLK
jgi:hypothetical protein